MGRIYFIRILQPCVLYIAIMYVRTYTYLYIVILMVSGSVMCIGIDMILCNYDAWPQVCALQLPIVNCYNYSVFYIHVHCVLSFKVTVNTRKLSSLKFHTYIASHQVSIILLSIHQGMCTWLGPYALQYVEHDILHMVHLDRQHS